MCVCVCVRESVRRAQQAFLDRMAVVHAQVELLSRYWDAVDTQRVDSEVAKMVMSDSSGRRKTLYVARPTPRQMSHIRLTRGRPRASG